MLTFVTAEVTSLVTLDEGELRVVELTMPEKAEIYHEEYMLIDTMRPGAAFIAQPSGLLRAYTRSNCSLTSPGVLQTVINKKETGAKTSLWWQSDGVQEGDHVNVRVDFNGDGEYFIYEHTDHRYERNLLLEPDEWWSDKHILCVAYYTGITPFLSWLRYMKAKHFGVVATTTPASYPFQRFSDGVAIEFFVSVRTEKQLIFHDELLALKREFPANFSYHPMLTREWPENWPSHYCGRIIDPKREFEQGKTERVDLTPLYGIVPFIESYHIRMCGGKKACNTMTLGLNQAGKKPLGVIRQEMW